MSSETDPIEGFVPLVDLDELREAGGLQASAGGRSFAAFWHEGEPHVTDLRCPHMGFPLTEGTVEEGILTCHWHHARFELSCGDTLDPFADDVRAFPTEVRDGTVYVDPDPEREEPPEVHWQHRLEHGLREDIPLVIAKAVIGLDNAGVPETESVHTGTSFGTRYRRDGWGRGLTTLGVMANLTEHVRPEDRRRALYAGLSEVADDCAGEPPFFVQDPLSARDVAPERLAEWFRDAIEVRDADGAERVLRAAIAADLPEEDLAAMLFGAATDHRYLDTGHRLDFTNKAFETLSRIGWEHADEVLPSLVPGLAAADRAEENASWRQPVDLAGLLFETFEDLPDLVASAEGRDWAEPEGFLDVLLGDDPEAVVDALLAAVEGGATAEALARVVAQAAARRVAQFGTSNEFNDWNTVHHTYTYANAVHMAARRTDAWELYRGVFDAAANVYLDRFLNMPPAPLPDPDGTGNPEDLLSELLQTFEVERDEEVDRAGRLAASYLAAGGDPDALKADIGRALLREDADFHTRQNVEAAFAQFDHAADPERARIHLVATARYLAAHTPTRRSGEQTFRIAERLDRGERIHEAAADEGGGAGSGASAGDD